MIDIHWRGNFYSVLFYFDKKNGENLKHLKHTDLPIYGKVQMNLLFNLTSVPCYQDFLY
jgi:hypothetical protein